MGGLSVGFLDISAWVLIVLGAGFAFYGYRLFRWWLAIQAFFVGAFASGILAALWIAHETISGGTWAQVGFDGILIIALLGGFLFAHWAFKAYRTGIFLIGAFVVGIPIYILSTNGWLSVFAAFAGGVGALWLEEQIMIGLTALQGGLDISMGLALMGDPSLGLSLLDLPGWTLWTTILFTALGIGIQRAYTARPEKREAAAPEASGGWGNPIEQFRKGYQEAMEEVGEEHDSR